MHSYTIDPRELSKFEYPDNPYYMYDPVLRLKAGFEPGQREIDERDHGTIGIHHDPEIKPGRHSMARSFSGPNELEILRNMPVLAQQVPFKSPHSVALARLPYVGEDRGETIRLKVMVDGFGFRCYDLRGSIERLNIPLVSNDVSSMYMGVIKAYPGLRILRDEYPPERFPNARTIEICVTTSGLTEGLARSVETYPMVEPPKPHAIKPSGPRSASVEAASMADEGWHRIASWPMRPDAH